MISLVGLDPAVKREYSWVGDPACDLAKSDVIAWHATGHGLEGEGMTVLVCEPLRPTTLQVVYGVSHGDIGNWAAVHRDAVAYSVVDIQNGPAIRRVQGPGGKMLHPDLMAMLESLQVSLQQGGTTTYVSLLQHLGQFVIADSEATASEKKVCVPPCTPEK